MGNKAMQGWGSGGGVRQCVCSHGQQSQRQCMKAVILLQAEGVNGNQAHMVRTATEVKHGRVRHKAGMRQCAYLSWRCATVTPNYSHGKTCVHMPRNAAPAYSGGKPLRERRQAYAREGRLAV